MVSPSRSGIYEATFVSTSEQEKLAANVALHPAMWVMMRLFVHHRVDPDEIANFLAVTFESKDAVIAKTYGDFNTEGTISLSEGVLTKEELEDDLLAEMQGEDWIDMSVINGKEAEVTRGERANGILFDHDDKKTLSLLSTKGVGELVTNGVSDEFATRNAGILGLRARMHPASRANGLNKGSNVTTGAPSPGQQGGEDE